jgi:branched-chain amino acid transport system ATP-binding protein
MLELQGLRVSYGAAEVVHGVDLVVEPGEAVGLIGPNGAGKTSVLRAVCGLRKPSGGRIELDGRRIDSMAIEEIARLGIALVPEGRQIFKTLSVEENLRLAAGRERGLVEAATERFPILRERARQSADRLSGGEQQQLALARAMVGCPRILLLDEPSLGLGPKLIESTYELLGELRRDGMTMLLVEQNAARTMAFCDRTMVMGGGRIRAEGSQAELRRDPEILRAYLGRRLETDRRTTDG